jgi:hypothetical protein
MEEKAKPGKWRHSKAEVGKRKAENGKLIYE